MNLGSLLNEPLKELWDLKKFSKMYNNENITYHNFMLILGKLRWEKKKWQLMS